MGFTEYLNENKAAIAFAAVLMLLVSAAYFAFGKKEAMAGSSALFEGISYKVAFTPKGEMKIFALAKNNELARLKAAEGNALPEAGSLVIGATEAEMMREEKLFSKPGDRLSGFFGINTRVEGILEKTGGPADMLHFLGKEQFGQINGSPELVFSRLTKEKVPKMFFAYDAENKPPFGLKLAERSVEEFKTAEIEGKKYCAVIVGADEAKMMRGEKLFEKPGDRINGFFGNDVFIAGVLEKANSSIDMFHFVTKDCVY